jgi:hypothetical protein
MMLIRKLIAVVLTIMKYLVYILVLYALYMVAYLALLSAKRRQSTAGNTVDEPTSSVTGGHEPAPIAQLPITRELQPAASSGHGNAQAQLSEQTLHNGRWYCVVTGIRGGKYIMVNGKKVYEGQWRQ